MRMILKGLMLLVVVDQRSRRGSRVWMLNGRMVLLWGPKQEISFFSFLFSLYFSSAFASLLVFSFLFSFSLFFRFFFCSPFIFSRFLLIFLFYFFRSKTQKIIIEK